MSEHNHQLIQQYSNLVRNGDGREYTVQSWARETAGGSWEGWLEYRPLDDQEQIRKTPPETSQNGWRELTHWAATLADGYLEEAFARAK